MLSCAYCNSSQPSWLCGGCKNAAYCGDSCQSADWIEHFELCGLFVDEKMPKDLIISQLLELDDLVSLSRTRGVHPRAMNIIDKDQGFFDRYILRHAGRTIFPAGDVRDFLSGVHWDDTKKNKFRLIFAPGIAEIEEESIFWVLEKPFFNLTQNQLDRLYVKALEEDEEEEIALGLLRRFIGIMDVERASKQAIRYGARRLLHLFLMAVVEPPNEVQTGDMFDRVVRSGHPHILEEILVDGRFDPGIMDNFPLRFAIRRSNREMIELLLGDSRVDPSIPEVFTEACERGDVEIVQLLLGDARIVPTPQGFAMAARYGHLALVQFLSTLMDPSVQDNRIVIEAATYGHLEVLNFLLADPRVNPTARNNLAIIRAAHFGEVATVERLMQDPRVNPADRNNDAFRHADNIHILELLLRDPRVRPNSNKLMDSIEAGDPELVDFLLRKTRIGENLIKVREALDYAVTRDEADCVRVINSFLHTVEAPQKQRRLIKVPAV